MTSLGVSQSNTSADSGEWKIHLSSAGACGLFLLAGVYFDRQPGMHHLAVLCYLISYLAGGWDALIDAWHEGRQGKLDIHFLMLAVAIGAAFIGAWWEGSVLLFLFSLSGALESMAMARTEKEIRSLFQESPKVAQRVNADGSAVEIPVDQLLVGERIRILPGSQFPVDGCVVQGATAADESMLTGESVPVEKGLQDTVFGGTLNTWGAVEAEVLRLPSESAHGKIIRLIREAQASKAPSQRFTDRFGTPYTLSILGLSFVAFAWWHWVNGLPAFGGSAAEPSALYRAMTLLVVCSPCALVISIPSAILAGIAAAARRGVLFRGGVALENLATIERLAVDKTGTLTKGEFAITAIETFPELGKQVVLEAAAVLSQQSTHPLSRAIAAEWLKQHGVRAGAVQDYLSVAGQGVAGKYQGREIKQGRRSYFPVDSAVHQFADPEPGYTEVLVDAGEVVGRIILRDAPRLESKAMIQRLHAMGIKVTMLTGDRPESAALLSAELGLDDSRSGLHPEDKVAAIVEWRQQGEVVAMVGDGINDAPSLAVADVSIGMGLRGSDAVLEQADVILLHDRLDKVLTALSLSRRCRAIIRQNLVISLGVLVLLGIGSIGFTLPLPLGVLGHEGSTLLVVLNSLRLLIAEREV